MAEGITLRTIEPSERDAVLDLLRGWLHDRAFFARYFEHDPTFRDDFCFVAVDGHRIVSTVQVFTKRVRIDGAALTVGGVGNVYTDPAYRRRGLAPALLQRAIAAMERQQFDVSLLFATRLELYGALGWRSHPRHLSFIQPGGNPPAARYRIQPFDAARDLDTVMELYDAHCRSLRGTTVRDRAYWSGQLRYAGNPDEHFLVAYAGSTPVAYARAAPLYDFNVILEHAVLDGYRDALADLFCHLHAASTLPGTLCQLACEPGFAPALGDRGLQVQTVEDVFWMWRVIDADRLAATLNTTVAATAAADFFPRLLPAERSVYWIADRF